MSSLALVGFLLAVTASPIAAHAIYKPEINWVDCAKNVPDVASAFDTSALNLANLPSTLHCGQLDVPMDYSKPFGDTNQVTLGLAMYRPVKPKGVIFL